MPTSSSTDSSPLHTLRDQIQKAKATAEKIVQDGFSPGATAQGNEATQTTPPDQGYQSAGANSDELHEELRSLADALYALRAVVPRELELEIIELLRQVLLMTRMVVDHWIIRLDRYPSPQSESAQQSTRVEPEPIPVK